MPATVKVCDIW